MGSVRGARNQVRLLRSKLGAAGMLTIKQVDGSTLAFRQDEALGDLFDFWAEVVEAEHHGRPHPDPPPALVAVANAVDRERALRDLVGDYEHLLAPVDPRELLEHGEIVPQSVTIQPTSDAPDEVGTV